MDVDGAAPTRQYHVGDSAVLVRRDGMDIASPLQDGIGARGTSPFLCSLFTSGDAVSDWDAMEKIWDHSFASLRLKRGSEEAGSAEANDAEVDKRLAFIEDSVNKVRDRLPAFTSRRPHSVRATAVCAHVR